MTLLDRQLSYHLTVRPKKMIAKAPIVYKPRQHPHKFAACRRKGNFRGHVCGLLFNDALARLHVSLSEKVMNVDKRTWPWIRDRAGYSRKTLYIDFGTYLNTSIREIVCLHCRSLTRALHSLLSSSYSVLFRNGHMGTFVLLRGQKVAVKASK